MSSSSYHYLTQYRPRFYKENHLIQFHCMFLPDKYPWWMLLVMFDQNQRSVTGVWWSANDWKAWVDSLSIVWYKSSTFNMQLSKLWTWIDTLAMMFNDKHCDFIIVIGMSTLTSWIASLYLVLLNYYFLQCMLHNDRFIQDYLKYILVLFHSWFSVFLWDIIAYPCPNFNVDSPLLKIAHESGFATTYYSPCNM